MVVRTRIEPLDRDIALIFAEELSPEAQSRALASFAREQFEEAQETNTQALGRAPEFERFVDGSRGAALERVKPGGIIIFEFELVSDVIEYIEAQLLRASPIKSGRYSKSHVLFADEQEVQFGADVPDASEYAFINLQPYSRKIERGLSKQAPAGVYQAVAALAAQRFGNVARIKFGFRTPLYGAIHDWAGKTKMQRKGGRGSQASRAEWLRRQPAIIVTGR